jgi:hypothetical protein
VVKWCRENKQEFFLAEDLRRYTAQILGQKELLLILSAPFNHPLNDGFGMRTVYICDYTQLHASQSNRFYLIWQVFGFAGDRRDSCRAHLLVRGENPVPHMKI